MIEDRDIKIANSSPSASIRNNSATAGASEEFTKEHINGNIEKAKSLGKILAEKLCCAGDSLPGISGKTKNETLKIQRSILMIFSATVGLEKACPSSVSSHSAQDSFYSNLQRLNPELYKNTTDTGAFSFYYLAYRRGNEIERRIGQTFAMLCSHDGDPIYQELGEAIYCWFASVVEKAAVSNGFVY